MDTPPTARRRLLDSKLKAPAAHPHQILRREALDFLLASPAAKVVLLRAPAGFGKSTVMLQYRERLEQRGVATAWLTLDRADNDASRFLTGLEAAVASLVGAGVNEPMYAPGEAPAAGDAALEVIARLAAHDQPFALFLDDFEGIQEPGVLGLVSQIIDELPRGGQLVIGSRNLPNLRIGRLRARGQLTELGTSRLRFSFDETAAFFSARRSAPLTRDELGRLHDKTEGWVAALWLTSVALDQAEVPAEFVERFSGTNQSLTDYLAEEVLARQPAHIRDFLLRTSVLKNLEAPLCDALMGHADGGAILRELEAADVLLVPLGDDRRSYRYHSLFALFLQSQLAREAPDAIPALHIAAAGWYEAQGRPVPAIDHAVEAGDTARALALLDTHALDLLSQGRMRLLSRWFDAIPPEALTDRPLLRMVQMWAVCFVRGPWEAMGMLEHSGLVGSKRLEVMAHVQALQPSLLAMMDRYEEAYEVGLESLRHLPSAVPFADTVLANAMATITSVMGEHQRARKLIDSARRGQGNSASAFNKMYSEAAEGIIDLQEARLRQALARFRMGVTATHAGNYSHTSGNAWAGVPYAAAVYEAGDLDQAAQLLQAYLPLARDVGLADHVIVGYTTLSRIAFHRGDVDQALQTLTELEYLGHKSRLTRVVANAKMERARFLLLQGHALAAREELVRADEPELWQRVERLRYLANDIDYMAIARLRWELLAGDAGAAARDLAAAAEIATAASRHRRSLKLRLLQAMALHRVGDNAAAMALLSEVLKTACAEGFVRLVLDEGEAVGAPLHDLVRTLQADGARPDPIFADYVQRLAQAFGPTPPAPQSHADAGPALLLEPLTRKEIRILHLLAEGYSNSAMSEKLFVSDSTVRTHLRNINTKLDAHSRTQAVALARRLGVIP